MPIPDFQTLMLPVLKSAVDGEANIGEVTARLAVDFKLTEEEREQRLPSGRQTTIVNRTGWAKTYLTKAGLLEAVNAEKPLGISGNVTPNSVKNLRHLVGKMT